MATRLPFQLVRKNITSGWRKITSYATYDQAIKARDFWAGVYVENGLQPVMELEVRKKVMIG